MCKEKDNLSNDPPDINKATLFTKRIRCNDNREFFFAADKFSEAEKILPVVEHSAKALLMSSYCYYAINFYDESISSLENFLKNILQIKTFRPHHILLHFLITNKYLMKKRILNHY